MDTEYSTYINGELIQVPTMEKLCQALTFKFQDKEKRITKFEEENKKLKEGIWEKEEFIKMKAKYEVMQDAYYRGFPITKEQEEQIKEWKTQHIAKKHNEIWSSKIIDVNFKYVFIPTSIGVFGSIKYHCGDEFTFQEEF